MASTAHRGAFNGAVINTRTGHPMYLLDVVKTFSLTFDPNEPNLGQNGVNHYTDLFVNKEEALHVRRKTARAGGEQSARMILRLDLPAQAILHMAELIKQNPDFYKQRGGLLPPIDLSYAEFDNFILNTKQGCGIDANIALHMGRFYGDQIVGRDPNSIESMLDSKEESNRAASADASPPSYIARGGPGGGDAQEMFPTKRSRVTARLGLDKDYNNTRRLRALLDSFKQPSRTSLGPRLQPDLGVENKKKKDRQFHCYRAARLYNMHKQCNKDPDTFQCESGCTGEKPMDEGESCSVCADVRGDDCVGKYCSVKCYKNDADCHMKYCLSTKQGRDWYEAKGLDIDAEKIRKAQKKKKELLLAKKREMLKGNLTATEAEAITKAIDTETNELLLNGMQKWREFKKTHTD